MKNVIAALMLVATPALATDFCPQWTSSNGFGITTLTMCDSTGSCFFGGNTGNASFTSSCSNNVVTYTSSDHSVWTNLVVDINTASTGSVDSSTDPMFLYWSDALEDPSCFDAYGSAYYCSYSFGSLTWNGVTRSSYTSGGVTYTTVSLQGTGPVSLGGGLCCSLPQQSGETVSFQITSHAPPAPPTPVMVWAQNYTGAKTTLHVPGCTDVSSNAHPNWPLSQIGMKYDQSPTSDPSATVGLGGIKVVPSSNTAGLSSVTGGPFQASINLLGFCGGSCQSSCRFTGDGNTNSATLSGSTISIPVTATISSCTQSCATHNGQTATFTISN